ncbi:MAG: low-specificity L-threonine aldolase [Planctomycetes bacterium]|nr:low-specificity L-threonine aldolase [Planctomycetota bacterium]
MSNSEFVDLRSDTVTQPSPEMRRFIAETEVGDDVYGEDPTVLRLEAKFAAMLGKEAAVYVPSGTMSNQAAVRAHCSPGDELICESNCHIYNWEQGGPAVLSGVTCRTIPGQNGVFDVEDLEGLVRPDNEHLVRTRLVCLENTHNRGGGRIFPLENIQRICDWAHDQGLVTHLDGARLFNAVVASGSSADEIAQYFDTVSVCFSKGLGAPVGSALAGNAEVIQKARRNRKLFGGAMRQAGIIAAGALFALENNVDRLAEDHANAKILVEAIQEIDGLQLDPPEVQTNLVWFRVDPDLASGTQISSRLREHGVLINCSGGPWMRACTHLDVSRDQVQHAASILREVCSQPVESGAGKASGPY